jgi:hypothetical protein
MFGSLFGKKKKPVMFNLTPEQDVYLADAIKIYNSSLLEYDTKYGFTKHDEWGLDQETGRFILQDNEKVVVSADGQIIGSFSSSDLSWEWAWNNPNVEPGMMQSSLKVKQYGEKEGIDYFCEGILHVPDESYAAYLAAVGQKASDSEVVYRGVMGDLSIFLLLNNFKTSRDR